MSIDAKIIKTCKTEFLQIKFKSTLKNIVQHDQDVFIWVMQGYFILNK